MAGGEAADHSLLNLDSLRKSLVRQEDTIVFALIERSKYAVNSPMYDGNADPPTSSSLFGVFLRESEALQSKAGRYTSEEENPFFPNNLPSPLVPPPDRTPVLHSPGASININDQILNLYLKTLLPAIASEGDDKSYAPTAASDLNCLQALSRRIHFGKFVAEVKFRDAPEDYTPAIRAKDRGALMELLTFESVEEVIKKRVEKKAKIFGGDVDIKEDDFSGNKNYKVNPIFGGDVDIKEDDFSGNKNYKVNPSVVSAFYGEWVIPLTKSVQVEYLLRRLD